MTLQRLFWWRARPGWSDDPDGALVEALEALAVGQVPDSEARVARSRDALLAEYRRAMADRAQQTAFRLPRLVPALAAAAVLIVVTAGGIAASGPGLPFYGVRLAAEELLLPSSGAARLMAQLDRLDRRLDEASGAIARGDAHAVAASLRAYEEISAELRTGQRPDSGGTEAANQRLQAEIRLLERLRVAAPGVSLAEAIGSARSTLTWLAGAGPEQGSPSPMPGSSRPTPSPPGGSAPASPATPPPTGSQGTTAPVPTAGASTAGSGGAGGPSASPGGNGDGGTRGQGSGG